MPVYNLSERELEILKDYLQDAEAKEWIRRFTSPAEAPILFVLKKDGSLRLCVDYKRLNRATVKNRHPLPLISETLDRLSGAKIFTKLNLKDAYHQIHIKEGDESKTAFRTRYSHWEYQAMSFGLANAPAIFQAYINEALSNLLDVCCVVYMDNILVYSNDLQQHRQDVANVLAKLYKYSLFVKLSKYEFNTIKVGFLGYVVSPVGVSMEDDRVESIRS